MRASIPIQGVLLLLLGAMAILPQGQDYVCSVVNNFASSFEPMLSWRGPGDVPF
jgi:Nuclear envelope localisation domain